MPGPKYAIDTHPDREKIIKAICKGDQSFRSIAKQYGISNVSVVRYVQSRLLPATAKEAAKRDQKQGKSLLERLDQVMERMQKLYDACDEYLTDPENNDKYNLDPRAWEIDIVYRTVEPDTDKMITRKESLQILLEKLDDRGYQPWEVRVKTADPRKLIVDVARTVTPQLELIAKIEGLVKDQVTNVTINQYWLELKAIIWKATEKHQEVREKIVKELEKVME